jgi:asparagine synthase (glutamine-hydrolysing)
VRGTYETAVAGIERLDGESDLEATMRRISHLHLTRFVRNLLDRKDRMSMAVGLEVRVPFCDHRLVEYVYNAPWSLKSFDGREKSLLRAASRDLLPQPVVDRVKSPYPSTQDLQRDAREYLATPDHPVFDVAGREWLAVQVALDAAQVGPGGRRGLERTLDLAMWLDVYRPSLKLT